MKKRISIASGLLVALVAIFALLLAASVPALAHHQDGHEQGQGNPNEQSDESSSEDSSEDPSQESSEENAEESADESSAESEQYASKGNGQGKGQSKKNSSSSESSSSDSSSSSSSSSSSPQGASDPSSEQQNCDPTHGSDTGHGANTDGPDNQYHNTCEPEHRPGNGQGNAKPCAGCVGNADDKNPPGQFPNGTDANNGYECDGNQGVGKENPAHTGCTPPVTCPPNTPGCLPPPPPNCPPNSNNPACNPVVIGEVCDGDMSKPGIQACRKPAEPCDGSMVLPGIQPCQPDVILGRRDFSNPERPPTPPTPPEIAPRPPLPFTGASVAGLMYLALAMMVLGGVLTRATRRS